MLQKVLDANYRIWGVDVRYDPPAGDGKDIRVIRSEPDELSRFGETSIKTEAHYFNVRKTDLPLPQNDATVKIKGDDTVYSVKNFMVINKSERLEWQLVCYVAN